MAKTKILYIEDETHLGKIVMESLQSRGYEVIMLEHGKEVIQTISSFKPDICILDVMLPFKNGFEIGNEIRSFGLEVPIIFLTAKNQTEDVVMGFQSGGNDYIRKPFSLEELILRVENLLKLGSKSEKGFQNNCLFQIGDYEFDSRRMELRFEDDIKKLSHRETQLLTILYEHAGRPVDRRKILNDIWGDDHFFNSRNLDVYIRKLRSYLEKDERVQLITLKGLGYQFVITD